MPMPYTGYRCSICLFGHSSIDQALHCEAKGQPDLEVDPYPIGSELVFENEIDAIGARYAYETITGKVIHSFITHNAHRRTYIVEHGNLEYEVYASRDGSGYAVMYVSPALNKYSKGYAASYRQHQENMRNGIC